MVRGIISHGVIVMTSRDLVSKIRRYSAKNFSCQVLLGNSKFARIGDHFGCVHHNKDYGICGIDWGSPIQGNCQVATEGPWKGVQAGLTHSGVRQSLFWNPASWHQRNRNLSL